MNHLAEMIQQPPESSNINPSTQAVLTGRSRLCRGTEEGKVPSRAGSFQWSGQPVELTWRANRRGTPSDPRPPPSPASQPSPPRTTRGTTGGTNRTRSRAGGCPPLCRLTIRTRRKTRRPPPPPHERPRWPPPGPSPPLLPSPLQPRAFSVLSICPCQAGRSDILVWKLVAFEPVSLRWR